MANLTFSGNSSLGASTGGGPIVGDHPDPYQFTTLGTGGTGAVLTTGMLNANDPGDFGGRTDLTIEFWFNAAAAASAKRNFLTGPEIAVGSRQWGFEINTTGTLRFYVRNSATTAILVTSTTVLQPGTWYHVAGVVDSAAALVRLYINGVQDVSIAWTSPPVRISSLSTTAGDMFIGDAAANMQMSFAALATYTRFIGATRIAAHYTAGASTGVQQEFPGQRIGDILDRSASVHAPRNLYAGSRIVTASYFAGQSPLDELRKAVAADNVDAMLFIGASGEWTFLDAANRSSAPYNTVQAIFGDAGGTELPYLDLTLDDSDSFLFNEWNVTREQGVKFTGDLGETKTATDATSVSRYFTRPASLSDVPVTTDTDSTAIATAMLAKYKDPMTRITSITLNTLDANTAQEVFRRELGDKIRVLRTPPGGGARIQEDLWIQKIEITGANDGGPWSVRFGVSPV